MSFLLPAAWNVDVKAGPSAATFGMKCMHRRAQNPKSLGPEVGLEIPYYILINFGFLYMKGSVLPA